MNHLLRDRDNSSLFLDKIGEGFQELNIDYFVLGWLRVFSVTIQLGLGIGAGIKPINVQWVAKIPEITKEKIEKFDYMKKICFNLASKNTVKKLTAWQKHSQNITQTQR